MWHHFNYAASAEMRKKYIPLEKVLEVAEIASEDIIVDIGGGDGYYTSVFSKMCKRVVFVDPSHNAVEMAKSRASFPGDNIEFLENDICKIDPPTNFTKVFLSNSFHDLQCQDELIEKMSRSNGRDVSFVLIEFLKDADIGPPRHIKIGPEELDEIFARHNYRSVRRVLLEKHYVTIFKTLDS